MMAAPTKRTSAVWENTKLGFETLRDRSFRSLLTVLGVSIGVIIIIGVAAVLNGFRQRIIDDTEQYGTSNIYITKFPMVSMSRPGSDIRNRKDFGLADAWAIKAECPAVLAVNPEQWSGVDSAKYQDKTMLGPEIHGCFPEMRDVLNFEMEDGRFFSGEENRQRSPVCVIGWTVMDSLFPRQSAVGKTITLAGRQYRVIGVIEKFKGGAFGDENPRDSMIVLPYYTFKQIFPAPGDHFINVRAKVGQLHQAIEQIEEVLRRRRHVAWKSPNDFEINTSSSMIESFDKIIFATLAVMFALSTVAFLVGGVGVMNVMFASVKERTKEIGLRRAIGARRRDIIWQFLVEAMALTGGGGIVGAILGETIMRGMNFVFPSMPCAIPMWARIFGFAGSVGIGLIFGLMPAISAARLDPIKALRYE